MTMTISMTMTMTRAWAKGRSRNRILSGAGAVAGNFKNGRLRQPCLEERFMKKCTGITNGRGLAYLTLKIDQHIFWQCSWNRTDPDVLEWLASRL